MPISLDYARYSHRRRGDYGEHSEERLDVHRIYNNRGYFVHKDMIVETV